MLDNSVKMVDCRVGDALVAVNGVDVTHMSEEEVKHLIATSTIGSVHFVVLPRQTNNSSRQSTTGMYTALPTSLTRRSLYVSRAQQLYLSANRYFFERSSQLIVKK